MRRDYLLTSEHDLYFENGDFKQGDGSGNQANKLLYSAPGENKQFPTLGLNILKYVGSNVPTDIIENAIITGLEAEGLFIEDLSTERTGGILKVNVSVS